MSRIDAPTPWSYSTEPADPGPPRRVPRWLLTLGAVVMIVLVVGSAAAVLWPRPAPPPAADEPGLANWFLDDKPPTVFLNALDVRSLYPPGYVDFDLSEQDPNADSGEVSVEDVIAALGNTFETTSEPPGCEGDAPNEDYLGLGSHHDDDPEHYGGFPVGLIMYPADNPGGNGSHDGYILDVYPADKPVLNLDETRRWYTRCAGAKVTITQSKDGRVVKQDTVVMDRSMIDPPHSAADDSYRLARAGEPQCEFFGLIRGMMVRVQCPDGQEAAGAELFRTAIARIRDI